MLSCCRQFFEICQSSNNENTVCQNHFASYQKKISRKKLRVDKRTEYEGTCNCFCQEKDIEVFSTLSKTEAEFAERAIQSSKHIINRYRKDYGKKIVPKLQIFVSTKTFAQITQLENF